MDSRLPKHSEKQFISQGTPLGIVPGMSRDEIIKRVYAIKDENEYWWWSYWSDSSFEEALLKRDLNPQIVKHILWKYENYLLSKEKQGYAFMQMEQIIKPELEHIAPQTPTDGTPIAAGYCKYDEALDVTVWRRHLGLRCTAAHHQQ